MGAIEPPSLLHAFPLEAALRPAPHTIPMPGISPDSCGEGDTLLSRPIRKPPIKHPRKSQLEAGGLKWKEGAGRERGLSCTALGSGGFSFLGPKDRETDGPCIPISLAFQAPQVASPSSKSFGELQEVWPQAPGPGDGAAWALFPHPHAGIYVQGHTDTDTYKPTASMHPCP